MPGATGYVREIQRRDGPVLYAKLKLADGSQPQRRLGKLWTKRTRPPDGYLTRGMAEARLAAILAGDDALVNVAPSHVTLQKAVEHWLAWLEHERGRKASTLKDYRQVADYYLLPAFGAQTPIENINTADIDGFRRRLFDDGKGRRTIQKTLVLLHGLMEFSHRRGWVVTNPATMAEKITIRPATDFNILSVEQVHAVARAAASEQLGSIVMAAAFTGLRLGELLALQWRDVDFAGRVLHVRRNYVHGVEDTPKSHRMRSVPLSDQAIVAFDTASRREHNTGDDDLVFCNAAGEHLSDDHVRDAFYAALKAAGLGYLRTKARPITFHDLRHSFGTLAVRVAPVTDVQRWLGHANVETTMVYVHHVPRHDDAAKLTEAFGENRAPRRAPNRVHAPATERN